MSATAHSKLAALVIAGSVAFAAPGGGILEVYVEARPDASGAKAWTLPVRGGGAPETVFLDGAVAFDQSQIASADVATGPDGAAQIRLVFTAAGTQRLLEITSRQVGKRLGIVIDGELRAAPYVLSPVSGGVLVVSGSFTASEAAALAPKLGPPAPAVSGRPAVAAGWLSPQEAASALAPLQGGWSALSATMDGRLRGDPKVALSTWTFRKTELTLTDGEGKTERFGISVESGAPNSFWLEPLAPSPERGGWMLFALDGSRLTLAFRDGLGERPEGFGPAPKKVLLKLARQGSVPVIVPCDILDGAGIAQLLPGGVRNVDRQRRAEGPACIHEDSRGQQVALMIIPAAGKAAFDGEVEEARQQSRSTASDEPDLGAAAVSLSDRGTLRYFVLKRETLVYLLFQTSIDARRLKEFAKRVLARVPEVP